MMLHINGGEAISRLCVEQDVECEIGEWTKVLVSILLGCFVCYVWHCSCSSVDQQCMLPLEWTYDPI